MELTIDQALQRGIKAHKEGSFQEAEMLYRAILGAEPAHPDANHNLGVLTFSDGKPEEAVQCFEAALKANPYVEQFWLSYISVLIEVGDFSRAGNSVLLGREIGVYSANLSDLEKKLNKKLSQSEKTLDLEHYEQDRARLSATVSLKPGSQDENPSLKRLLAKLLEAHRDGYLGTVDRCLIVLKDIFPAEAQIWSLLGANLRAQGKSPEALHAMQKALTLIPSDPEAHCNLGVALKDCGRFDEAEAAYRKAISLEPNHAPAHSNLGSILEARKQYAEAEASYRTAITLNPDSYVIYNNLGNLLCTRRDFRGAEDYLSLAINKRPDYAPAHLGLGNIFFDRGMFRKAEVKYREAIRHDPNYARAYGNLGGALTLQGRLDEAETIYRESIALQPNSAEVHSNLAAALKDLGKYEESVSSYKAALRLDSSIMPIWSNLLFMHNYNFMLSSAELFREYETYAEVVSSRTKHQFTHENHAPISGRRIRVGYSSPDYRGHACRFFMEPIFRNHDRDQFELFAYSNTLNPDQHTERMKGFFDHWIDVVRMTDEEMGQRIYEDQIDILVDMAGHTKGNRLPVFAMRPAPIQASSWIGFGYTTGLKEVDYFICDQNVVPAGSECYFSEEPWRLPAPGCAYQPPAELTPDVSDLPALRNGYVTFGSLTRTVRINDPLLRVWSEILARVPNSRLRLDQKLFAHEGMRELFWKRLEGLGLPRERVELTCSSSHWSAYHDIDITLDCWPHNAGTTTLESLWMGVPVLSKMDRPSVGRISAAALKPLGLDDWLVETAEAYVEKAVSFASDLEALSELRAELRNRVDQGPHLDAATITGHLEFAYLEMIKILEA